MSDPVTDVEIEDVLSSIRRLVGDEHRGKPRMAPEPDSIAPPAKPTRLVLTPSLLVPVPDTEPEVESAAVSDLQEQISETPFEFESSPTEDEVEVEAEPLEDAGTQTETDFVFESSQVHDKTSAEEEPGQAAWADPEEEPEQVASADPEEEPEQVAWANPEATLFNAAEISDSIDKMLVEDVERPIWEASAPQEASSPFEVTPQAASSEEALEQADPESPFADDLDDTESTESDNDPEDDTPYSTATLGAKIAALEAKIGQTQDQWEPDGELGDDYAGTRVETIDWQDHDAEDQTEARSSEVPPTQPEPNISDEVTDQTDSAKEVTDFTEAAAQVTQAPVNLDPQSSDEPIDLMAGDDAILDEESLRELVADIVRQELQGALGERITRNVRKLVRREIHRALTAQELD